MHGVAMDLKELTHILKENGDQVLNASSKLSLSTLLLKDLNKSFSLIVDEREALNSTFQVIGTSNSKVDFFLDLSFLHDFVQKTQSLKITPLEEDDLMEQVDISKFKNLKLLELYKIPVNKIVGLNHLKSKLQYLICVRSINSLKDLFAQCDGDKNQCLWNELKEAVLSYNNLTKIDNCIKYAPYLHILDLSHNSIVNIQALDCLTNLKYLNLSFNHLEAVPTFNKELSQKLQVLVLKNNYIENLAGLLYFDNLSTLDLSYNCLVEHCSLNPIPQLAALQWLNLEGNPLSFHPCHRDISASYLHKNSISFKFILDHSLLSKSERILVGYHGATISRSPNTVSHVRELQSSVSSNLSEITYTSEATTIESELTRSFSNKGCRVRNAIIAEKEENEDVAVEIQVIEPIKDESNDHLLTKEKIEQLRKKDGETWLNTKLTDILGMKDTATRNFSSTPYGNEFREYYREIFEKETPEHKQSPSKSDANIATERASNNSAIDSDNTVTSDFSTNNTFFTAEESDTCVFEDRIEVSSESISVTSEEDNNEDAGEEFLYLAELCQEDGNREMLFIVIANNYIKEQDTGNGSIKAKWLLEILKTCQLKNNCEVNLEFDTVRRNMQKRKYILSEEDAQKLTAKLNNYLSSHVSNDTVSSVLCCLNCAAQFNKNHCHIIPDSENKLICPNCKSKYIYEIDDGTPTNQTNFKNIPMLEDRPRSPSECSIASECENGIAQICVTADVHRDSSVPNNLPADCSAVSMGESNSSHISTEENLASKPLKKCESDIEIISNPSQSSIEVLEESRHTKRLSEERKVVSSNLATIPDVVTVPPTVLALAGLTESSSSSSFTESVCTAYDSQTVHASRPSSGMDIAPILEEISSNSNATNNKTDDQQNKNLISSILGGLFTRTTTGTKPPGDDSEQIDIFFKYSDDFSTIDHRVKLHLYQNIFEEENEDFVWLLKCFLLNKSMSQPTLGCFVFTTCNMYMLYIVDHTAGQNIAEWLIKKSKWRNDKLISLFVLPSQQGIGVDIMSEKNVDCHLGILQDVKRTLSFLTHLTNNPLPDNCTLITEPIDQPVIQLQQFLTSCISDELKDVRINMLAIFKKCTVTKEKMKEMSFGALLLTNNDLIVLDNVMWLIPENEHESVVVSTQPINNLIEMEQEELTLDLHFLDEIARCEEVWSMQWETLDSIGSIISAIQAPWEKIFSVPLQVTHKVHSV